MSSKYIEDLCEYIAIFPIKWYAFVNRVLPHSIYYDNIMILPNDQNNIICINEIAQILLNDNIIYKKASNPDFVIWYFNNKRCIIFFEHWFKLLVIKVIKEMSNEFYYSSLINKAFFIQLNNIRINVYSRIIIINDMNNNIIYLSYDYNYSNLKKQLIEKINCFFVNKKI